MDEAPPTTMGTAAVARCLFTSPREISGAASSTSEVPMAVVIDGGGGDRKKPLHAELNLVPYIDLLTCMVAFLLITAVWTQLARLEVQQKGQGELDSPTAVDETRIAVAVHDGGFNLIVKTDQKPFPLDYPRLVDELRAVKRSFPDKTDVQIISEDGIVFDTLVKTMDAVMSAGFPAVSLLDAAPG
jgi:biopolymer transport protein TolR